MNSNVDRLIEYAQNKSKITLKKVDNAINELVREGEKVNFNSVSKYSGVSKSFLYNNVNIKIKIEEIREKQKRKKLKVFKDGCFEKELLIKKLKEENNNLKKEIKLLRENYKDYSGNYINKIEF